MELSLFRIFHHLLEVGPPVCFARDRAVSVDLTNRNTQLRSIGLGLLDLLLNARVFLGVATVPRVDDAVLAASVQRLSLFGLYRFFWHRRPLLLPIDSLK